mgnify:FL=1|tara:strand:+ start:254 stop:742 length:489 start_codon:yes stop_codon:yes gene_type:complete
MYVLELKVDNSVSEEVKQYYNTLALKESSDSGIDLIAIEDVIIGANKIGTLNFKIKCQMTNTNDNNYYPYYLYPRSSISKTPLLMANSVGIIDKDYRGDIMAKVRHMPFEGNDDYNVEKGTRLFQICSPDLSPLKLVIVKELTETSRGEGGFGSTGSFFSKV